MRYVFSCVLVLLIPVVSGSSPCDSKYDFPCEDGDCIDSGLWCDTTEDCLDGSDEKYCKNSTSFDGNPNKCSSAYFKCNSGPCIPKVGRCDGYNNCEDFSDEKNCDQHNSSPKSDSVPHSDSIYPLSKNAIPPLETRATTETIFKSTERNTTDRQPLVKIEKSQSKPFLDSTDPLQHSIQILYSDSYPSDYTYQREKARNWLLSQRTGDFGWGDETSRAITALYLSNVDQSVLKKESDLLMIKQLEVQLSLGMARNGTNAMQLTDLALYINALLASCKDPRNFYGENLVQTLRDGVDAAQKKAAFVNPSVYLTLCISNSTKYGDTTKLHNLFSSKNATVIRMDIQALAVLTSTCISRSTKFLYPSAYEEIKRQFIHKINATGIPGNVYEAALLAQALQELKVNLPGLLEFILNEQQEDGSFGSILATYLVLPVLASRSFLEIYDHCGEQYNSDLAPIEVLKNSKRRKIYLQYALKYGNPPEITETIHMQIAEGINFLDVMRLAQEINPKYRFMLDVNRDLPIVYSIGGIPNDAEKGMFWTLHLAANKVRRDSGRLAPYSGSIKQLIPHAGDEFVFWMKSV